jgi:hypothetical protein
MNADIFAEWLRRQGQQVTRTASTYWHSEELRVYQAFPYHALIEPSKEELADMFFAHGAIALRYSTPADSAIGLMSYHAVHDKPSYDINSLGAWARKNVRRGLKNCVIEPISVQRFVDEGWALRSDTLDRQGRHFRMSRETWKRRYLMLAELKGFEIWAALVQGRLGAFLVTVQMEEVCYFLYQQCHRDYLREHVNNALTFVVTQTMIQRPGIRCVFYGTHSLDAPASVDEFKFRMGYRAKRVRQRVIFHPYLLPFVNRISYWLLKRMGEWMPASRHLAKAEGMFRFYLGGNPSKPPKTEDLLRLNVSAGDSAGPPQTEPATERK